MRHGIPKKLLNDARELYQTVSQQLVDGVWAGFDRHLWFYNELIRRASQYDERRGFPVLDPVPPRKKGSPATVSLSERLKLIELVQKSLMLYEALKDAHERSESPELRGSLTSALTRIQRICDRFHLAALALQREYHGCRIRRIANEYQVQWLLKAMLSIDFDDVRPEEWTPSYAGGAARMDFLIAPYAIVIETKVTRGGFSDKRLGEELIIDAFRYQKHPDCRVLYCFVYDPERRLSNARGLERDLGRESGKGLAVKVAVRPL